MSYRNPLPSLPKPRNWQWLHRPAVVLFALLSAGAFAAEPAAITPAQAVIQLFEATAVPIEGDARAVVQAGDGSLVVGSNILGVFDGARWQKVDAANVYAYRALAAGNSGGPPRVWVGAMGEIGFIMPDDAGIWRYTSLLDELHHAGLPAVQDVWSVHVLENTVIWVTTRHVLRRTQEAAGARFEIWELPSPGRLSAFNEREAVLLHREGIGLLRLTATGGPSLIVSETDLPATPVTWMVPSRSSAGMSLIGLGNEAYRWNHSGGFEKLETLSQALDASLPVQAVPLEGDRIAIGTFNGGIILANEHGDPLAHYSRESGLPDNSVYSLWSHGDQLWAASPSGLMRIDGVGHAWFHDRQNSLDGGRALSAIEHRGDVYVLTTKGLLRHGGGAVDAHDRLERILDAPGLFTDSTVVGDALWVSGFAGLWRVTPNSVNQEFFVSSDVLAVAPTSRIERGLLFLEGYRLKALVPSAHGGWAALDLGAEVFDSPVSLLEDAAGDVWVSTMQQGIVRFEWDSTGPASAPRLRSKGNYRAGVGLPFNAGRTQLVQVGTRLYAFTQAGILALRSDGRGFEPSPDFSGLLGLAATRSSPDASGTGYWLVQAQRLASSDVFAVVKVEVNAADQLAITELDVPGLGFSGAGSTISFTSTAANDSLWIGGSRGLHRVAAQAIAPAAAPPRPSLRVAMDGERANAVTFTFGTSVSAAGESYFYQTQLQGADADWSPPQRVATRTFGGLAAGNYRFDVRAFDRFGRLGPVASHSFVIHAPGWKTPPAFAAYAVLLAALVFAGARWQVARLRRQNERLNRLVADRTREIELASTAKSEFLDNVSHEIRNPLNGLTGLLAMLKEERLDPRERELTRSLKSVAATLTQVFEDVLQFSKLEYGYGRLERRPFALRPVLEEILALFAAQAHQAGCALRLDWPPALADGFEGDPEKIKTIIVNFVGNALKYAPGAPVVVRAEVTGEADGMVDLYLDVIDHGPGVPPEEQELIFKKFVRGRRAQESKLAGTGLGLATCGMLAKMMNGSIGIESSPGHGATFHLKLLLPRAQLADSDMRTRATPPEASVTGPILIVEDEAYNRVVLEGIAWELGCIADAAASAEEAMQRLAAVDYPVVLLDWELPDGKGGDIARALRARPQARPPIILATTAHDSEEMRERCREAGMDGFLAKPYNAATVRHAIATALSNRNGGNGAPPPAFNGDDGDAGELDLSAFEHYTRARPDGPDAARRLYVEAIDSQASVIAEAISLGQTETISREAHRLRALSGMVRATDLNRAAARLEQLARDGVASEYDSAWAATKHACEALRKRLA